MGKSLVRAAAEAFMQGRYTEALHLYRQLAMQFGEKNFRANLTLCQQRIGKLACMQLANSPLQNLRVAAVMDDFTYHSFAPECQLLNLNANHWQEQVEAFRPDFVFVESAWRGVEESWKGKVVNLSPELLGLLDWARANGVGTAFWNKEDPVHFSRFMPLARLVDHVFTTDIDCIIRYKETLQHDRVYLLPFGVQPVLHNPIETVGRQDIFSFAGSWYSNYLERQADFRTLVGVGRKLKTVAIYDRNANRPQPHDFVFPDEYRDEIRGSLPYTEIDQAYKGCRYGITVNTVKQSATMFARRALELMASNTVVVSNFSKGLRFLFGDHVISSDSAAELEHRLAPLIADEAQYRKHRLRALRKVLAEHTCEHRLAYVAGKVLNRSYLPSSPNVAMLAEPANALETGRAISTLERQNWPHVTLVLVGRADPINHPRVQLFPTRELALPHLMEFDYIAPLAADDYYGPDYLTDLVLATRYSQSDALTKATFYVRERGGSITLKNDGSQYRPTPNAAIRRSLLKPALLTNWVNNSELSFKNCTIKSTSILSLDEFGYCAEAEATLIPDVDVGAPLRAGLSLPQDVLPRAEAIEECIRTEKEAALRLDARDWHRYLPKDIDPRLRLTITNEGLVEIESNLSVDEYRYLYFSRELSSVELNANREVLFRWMADSAHLDVRSVFVFQDSNQKKISHVMHRVGDIHGFSVPAGTASTRLALRIQGSGKASLGKLSIGMEKDVRREILPSARHLVVANQYPSYEDLYRYGFVHARVRAYGKVGVIAEILRVTPDPHVVYREFENVDVTEGGLTYLDQCLAGGHYQSILVHIINDKIWGVVRKYLDRVRVVIWAHGAEIQPWWRRAMIHTTDAARQKARRNSDARLAMWRDILSLHHPNLRVVFVSHNQAAEALTDLQLPAAEVCGVEVISNFIDGELFGYQKKDPALRHRLLSIRPYASPIYANDLSVAAILHLSKETFFDQLHIRIIGDGVLFDETVAPLRDFPNVQIERRFLTQREIAALHREYGVFLVPSRMDTQGVSRDEAMASGLVPITNRIAAIPEFVDSSCAFLAEPEDAVGLADAVRQLHESPDLFSRMSEAAARRVRSRSGFDQTIARELALFTGTDLPPSKRLERLVDEEARATRFALYGDVNLNIMDGSAVWAASLAEVLAGIPGTRVALVLKARIQRTQVITRPLVMAPAVQLIEPDIPEGKGLTPAEAVSYLISLDCRQPFHGIILRGLEVCHVAAQEPALRGRLWAYLTDIPQKAELIDPETRARIGVIIDSSAFVLAQTPQLRDYLASLFPQVRAKVRLLPPMIPPHSVLAVKELHNAPFRFVYAGKFAPRWGIRELFAAQKKLFSIMPDAELHVFGDKIHNPPDDPNFAAVVKERLAAGDGLYWHGAVSRDELLRRLTGMHACWAYRDPTFERETLELSTKVLEYASLGLPIILARSQVFEALLGASYPLFASSDEEATEHLLQLACDPALRKRVGAMLEKAAARYTFTAVRKCLVDQFLLSKKNLT
jgi:glycosyltransferase involved in cell wall biosynthesis/spore maturation protein CgeB